MKKSAIAPEVQRTVHPFAKPQSGNSGDWKRKPVAFIDPSRLRVLLLYSFEVMLYSALYPLDVVVIEGERCGGDIDAAQGAKSVHVQLRIDTPAEVIVEKAVTGGSNGAAA